MGEKTASRLDHGTFVRALADCGRVPRSAPKKIRRATERVVDEYVKAHSAVHREELSLAKEAPHLRFSMFALDPVYQYLRHDLLRRTGAAPSLACLTGPTSAIDALRAIRFLEQLLEEWEGEPWTKNRNVELFRARAGALDTKTKKRVDRAVEHRARKHGALVEHLRHVTFAPTNETKGHHSGSDDVSSLSSTDWAQSVVRVFRGKKYAGSAVFVRPDLVLTAGHVAKASGTPSPSPSEFRIQFPHVTATTTVNRVQIHPGWDDDESPDKDLAVFGVDPVDGLGLRILWNFGPQGVDTSMARYGYPADPNEAGFYEGNAQRSGDMFYTDDASMQIPAGASGGPLLSEVTDGLAVGGVGTHRGGGAGYQFIGLPLIQELADSFDFDAG